MKLNTPGLVDKKDADVEDSVGLLLATDPHVDAATCATLIHALDITVANTLYNQLRVRKWI